MGHRQPVHPIGFQIVHPKIKEEYAVQTPSAQKCPTRFFSLPYHSMTDDAHYFHVIFAPDYSSVKIINNRHDVVLPEVTLFHA